ncbi:MAG: hypothetical protein HOK06_03415 [Rhodospirillaceae bacterium]|jgi:hypothetical protein|nr:hypothetical protein [Rhodospirillaceae bacterium]MBT4220272.1 hypothetical protein [Rhodospirillaceae bacterium]MBT4463334.1 hypothetical protein [Rhodospirillaceae bacterium]MBT5014569.1 hypothetical protein [Rhodospirillaceae bacterium]MBT5308425.1 hypothetical protein [Rhodospirillaceae bacterium]
MALARVLLIAATLAMLSGKAWALDLGLTPSHVYSLWTNINRTVIECVNLTVKDTTIVSGVKAMATKKFTGKKPADVLALALHVEGLWNTLRIQSDLPPTLQAIAPESMTTPTDVYLESSKILASSVEWIIGNTDSSHLVAGYFVRHTFKDKTPSDVYALVDLAQRRMQFAFDHSGLATQSGEGSGQ